jgi:hypothetical protein
MDRAAAWRKFQTLLRMTTGNGCQPHEADTAMRLARTLDARFGFGGTPVDTHWRPDFAERFARAEAAAARRFNWEYRRCGKRNCWCRRSRRKTHGPYRYAKERRGHTVVSIYIGK